MYKVYLLDGFLICTTDDLNAAKGIIAVYGGTVTDSSNKIVYEVK